MAFDNSLPRGDAFAAQHQTEADAGEGTWTRMRAGADVEDKSSERPSRPLYATHSVRLWDEIEPVPSAQPDAPQEPPEG